MAAKSTVLPSSKTTNFAASRRVRGRQYMLAREQKTVDRAMEILTDYMRRPSCLLNSPDLVKRYLCLNLGSLPYEVFGVLFLDAQHRLIAYETMFRGTLTQTSVYPREVVTQALLHNAAFVVLAHNHPSGAIHPSQQDEALTQALKAALALVEVSVLDHVIVGGSMATSMAELGVI